MLKSLNHFGAICHQSKPHYTTRTKLASKSTTKIFASIPQHLSSTFATLCQFAIRLTNIRLLLLSKRIIGMWIFIIWLPQFSRCLQSQALQLFISDHFFPLWKCHNYQSRSFQIGSIESAMQWIKSNENECSNSISMFNLLWFRKCMTFWSRSLFHFIYIFLFLFHYLSLSIYLTLIICVLKLICSCDCYYNRLNLEICQRQHARNSLHFQTLWKVCELWPSRDEASCEQGNKWTAFCFTKW